MRTTIDLPEDLHRIASAIARDTGKSLSQTIAERSRRTVTAEDVRALEDAPWPLPRGSTHVTPGRRTVFLSTLLLLAAPLWAEEWAELSEGIRASDTVLVGGQPTRAVLQQAADAGVKVVVNFRSEAEDPGYDEAAAAAELGLTYLRVPVAGEKGLTQENVLLFDAVLQQVGDKPALMHCSTGNRVGAIHALHAARFRDLDADAAIDYGKQYGLTHFEDEVLGLLEE